MGEVNTLALYYRQPQRRIFNGKVYSFNGWLPTKKAVEQYRKDRGGYMRTVKGRSRTGKLGYFVYVRSRR